MYVCDTTAAERDAIRPAMDDIFCQLERCNDLLLDIWGDHFAEAEQKAIPPGTAGRIAGLLGLVTDTIYALLLQYALITGWPFHGVTPYITSAKRAMGVIECNELMERANSAARTVSEKDGQRRAAIKQCDAIAELSDAQAIPLLKALLKGGETI